MGVIEIVIVASVALQAANFWLLSKGNIVYPLIIAIYTMYMVVEGWLAMRDPGQQLVWLYVALNAWSLYCASKGWYDKWSVSKGK